MTTLTDREKALAASEAELELARDMARKQLDWFESELKKRKEATNKIYAIPPWHSITWMDRGEPGIGKRQIYLPAEKGVTMVSEEQYNAIREATAKEQK